MNGDRAEAPAREMPRYQCHKKVWALKISAVEQAPADQERRHADGDWLLRTDEPGYAPICVGHSFVLKHKPEAGGYYVVYDDGYKSYSPAKAFEEGYAAIVRAGVALNDKPVTDADLARISKGPRVTLADIESNIDAQIFLTGKEAAAGVNFPPADRYESLGLLTICIMVLANGYTIVGTSACASPDNFDPVIGRRIAREDCIRQIWPLLGFALKDRLTLPVREG